MDFKESLQTIKIKMEKTQERNMLDVTSYLNNIIVKPYTTSEKEAIEKGFEEVEDHEAYNGRYFIKDDLIWIHNIQALKSKLGIYDEDELRYMNYDVDTYYDKKSYSNISKTKKLRMYDEKEYTGIDYGFENMVYLSDGVYIHKNDCWF
jgi:predicted DNA-binding protein